jgi:hypothetical protein
MVHGAYYITLIKNDLKSTGCEDDQVSWLMTEPSGVFLRTQRSQEVS